MKIGLVCPYDIFRGGGVQEVVLELQKELTKRGHSVKIITPLHRNHDKSPKENILDLRKIVRFQGESARAKTVLSEGEVSVDTSREEKPFAAEIIRDGDERALRESSIIFIGASTDVKSPFHTYTQVSVSLNNEEIKSMLEREKFDVLNFHEPWVPIMSRQLLAKSKCVNVATFHAKLPETAMSKTIEKVITPYTKSVLKNLNELTAVSDAAAEYVRTLTPRPITIIPNGINLDKYKLSAINSKKPANKKKTILYIGRLEKRKGVKYLIKAFGMIQKDDPNIKLVIAGSGPDRNKLEDQVKNNHISNVKFAGYVSEPQKISLLEKADIFCSPALYGESFGIVLLEAMAKGIVTVAGNNSGYTSVLKEMGEISIINPKDTEEFARRLHLLLYDEHLRDLWQKWAKDYVKQFSYLKIVDQYEALYIKSAKSK